jgi:hypothetical protein
MVHTSQKLAGGYQMDLLLPLLKAGGISALAVGVFFLLYKQLLQMQVFRRMGSGQTFSLLLVVVFLVWLIAIIAVLSQDGLNFASINGSWNEVQQRSP